MSTTRSFWENRIWPLDGHDSQIFYNYQKETVVAVTISKLILLCVNSESFFERRYLYNIIQTKTELYTRDFLIIFTFSTDPIRTNTDANYKI